MAALRRCTNTRHAARKHCTTQQQIKALCLVSQVNVVLGLACLYHWQVLRAHGISVLTVREILAFGVEERMGARVELEELAASTLTYKLADGELALGQAAEMLQQRLTILAECCI